MALEKQNVPINFGGGVDTKTDPKQVIPGKLLTLENGIFTSLKRIKKRNGYEGLSQLIEGSLSSITQGNALANFKEEIVLFTGKEAYSLSESTERWSDKGPNTSVSLSSISIIRNTYQQTTPDSSYHSSGLEIFTWEDSRGGSRYSIFDSITGEAILSDSVIDANAIKPKAFALGNYIIIVFIDNVTNHLRMLPIPVLTPTAPLAKIDIALNVNVTNKNYDATYSNDRVFVAYNTSTGGGSITLKSINNFLGISAARDTLGESASSCIAVTVDTPLNQVWVAYHNGAAIKYFIYDRPLSFTPILAPTVIEINGNTINNIALIAASGSGQVFYTQNAAATYNNFIKTAMLTNTGTVTGVSVFLRSVGIAAKPFYFDEITYITVAFDTVLQPTYFLIDVTHIRAVAKFSPSLGGGLLTKNIVPETTPTINGHFLIASLKKDLLTTISGAVYTRTGVNSTVLNFVSENALSKVELGENLHITGGMLFMYDGVSIVEHGFNMFPENVMAATSTTGGLIEDGQRQYSVTYEWMDNEGQTHYSAPSVPITVTNTGGGTSANTLTIPTLRVTDKKPPVRGSVIIGVYRTEDSGTIFYRVSSVTSPTLNDTTVDSVVFVDTLADSAIIGNQLLYTTGGVVENIQAPAASFVTSYKDRIILLPDEDTNQWWYSKQVVPGVPVEFSDLFVNNIDQAGGKLVSAARMDSVLVFLKQNLLYYVTGTGPDSTGAQNDFSEAQPIACDGGCTDKNSVILIPAGLMYKSEKGIYILDRSLSVHYIGHEVEAYNNDHVISANLIENTTQVRFCLDSGVALMYDYLVEQWSVFTNHKAVDSIIFQGQFTYLTADGLVLQETPGQYSDNGEFIQLRLITSWLSFAGLQGFQRVRRLLLLGEYNALHNLRVFAAYDFNPYATQETVIPAGQLLGTGVYGSDAFYGDTSPYGGAFPLYQFVVKLSRQKCETIQFTIEDTQSGLIQEESFSISAMSMEVGIKRGLNKMAATNTFG